MKSWWTMESSRASRVSTTRGAASLVAALLTGLAALAALPASAAAQPSTEDCLMCHRDPSLAQTVGRAGSLRVDPQAFESSVHARLTCVGCHTDAEGGGHAPHLKPVTCGGCHRAESDSLATGAHHAVAETTQGACVRCHGVHDVSRARKGDRAVCASCHATVVQEYESSVHGVALARGDTDASTCRDCHGGTHAIRVHTDSLALTSHVRIDRTCARCHADRALVARRGITIPQAVQLFQQSVHGRSTKAQAARCNDCHESHRLRRATDPTSSIYRQNIPTTCGRCHLREARAYAIGIHGTAVVRGVTAAPVCTDCHGEHMIQGPKDLDSPVAAGNVTKTCSHCHEATGIRETYGLPAGRLESYRDSYHGLAARGGSRVVANCESCHGYHDILPSSDPRSSVSPQRLTQTCGRCHPGINENVRLGPVHVAFASAGQPVLFWARFIYIGLIAGTIGFMLLHNGLDYFRKIARSLGAHLGRIEPHAHAARRFIERMNRFERIQHGLLAVSFFTLVYTGFALKFPEAYPFAWLAHLEGGQHWRGIIHRVAAVVMVVTSMVHIAYLATPRGRRLVFDLFPTIKDGVDLLQNTLYLAGLRRAPAQFARFGYIEKAEYWALIWGTVVMTVTGGLLWFENSAMQVLPKWALDLATLVHYYEAWLAFLAIVVWHLYQNILNPDVYPMNWTWLTGRISDEQLRHEHFLEWQERFGPSAAEEDSDAAAPAAAGRPGGAETRAEGAHDTPADAETTHDPQAPAAGAGGHAIGPSPPAGEGLAGS
jgi:cytochrome b subunit of formate dehydrogenase